MAASEEDTPLEVWLSRSYYGNNDKRSRYSSFAEEMSELNMALYSLQVTLDWSDDWGKDEVELQILMPGYTTNSDYEYSLILTDGKSRKTVVFRKELVPKPVRAELHAVPANAKLIPADEVLEISKPSRLRMEKGSATLEAAVKVNEDWFNRAELFVRYYPDLRNKPELAMPAPGGRTYIKVD